MTKLFLLVFCQAERAYPNSPEKILFPEPYPNVTWEEDGWHRPDHVRESTSTSMVRAVMVQCSKLFPDQGSFATMDVRLLTINTGLGQKAGLGIAVIQNRCICSRACLRIYSDFMTCISMSLGILHSRSRYGLFLRSRMMLIWCPNMLYQKWPSL